MVRTRTRKILKDLWSRKVRTILVSLSIFIGVLGVVTLVSAGQLLLNQLEQDLQEERLTMVRVLTTTASGQTVDNEAYLESLQGLDGVSNVELRAAYPFFWKTPNEEFFNEAVIVAHSEPFAESYIEPIRLVDGRFPENADSSATLEVAIERRFADKHDLGIGDTLDVQLLSQAGANDNAEPVTAQAEIVGIVFQPYGLDAGFVQADALVFAQFDTAQQVAGFTGYNLTLVRYDNFDLATDEAVRDLEGQIRASGAYVPVNTNRTNPAENPQIEQTQSTSLILATLAVIALIVSGLLILNVVSSIISEQRQQIGIMKSLGATGLDIFYVYAGVAVMYGVLGAIPGVILGIPAGYFAAQGLGNVFGTVLEDFSVIPSAVILGLVLGIAIPFLAAILPVILGTRVSIRQALTDLGIGGKFGQGMVERVLGKIPFPLALQQSINNAYQKKWGLVLTGFTLTTANGAFMGIFSVFYGLSTLVGATFDTYGNQISIQPNEGQDFNQISTLIEDINGINEIEPGVQISIQLPDYELPPVVAGPPGTNGVGFNTANPEIVNLELLEGDGWENDPQRDGVVLSSAIAEATSLQVGDEVAIIAGGNQQSYEVIGIANFPFNSVWFKWQELANLGGLVNSNGEPYPNRIDVVMNNADANTAEVDDKIAEINDRLVKNGVTAQYNNIVEFAGIITQIITIFGIVLSLAAFLIAAVGGVGLLTTLSISVFERQKEIGVMRSVGATSANVAFQFVLEGIVVGFAAWLMALPISLVIRTGLLAGLPFGDTFDIPYPPLTWVIGLVGMIFLVIMASLLPAWSASRRTVSDILRYQ